MNKLSFSASISIFGASKALAKCLNWLASIGYKDEVGEIVPQFKDPEKEIEMTIAVSPKLTLTAMNDSKSWTYTIEDNQNVSEV